MDGILRFGSVRACLGKVLIGNILNIGRECFGCGVDGIGIILIRIFAAADTTPISPKPIVVAVSKQYHRPSPMVEMPGSIT